MIRCNKCKSDLFQTNPGKIKLRTNIIIFEKGIDGSFDSSTAVVLCPKCKEDNEVPILLDTKNSEIKHLIFEKS